MNFFHNTKRIQGAVISLVIFTLFMTATIVTIHTFMFESHGMSVFTSMDKSAGHNGMMQSQSMEKNLGNETIAEPNAFAANKMLHTANDSSPIMPMMSEDCCCQPVQCQSIMAQIDLSHGGLWDAFIDFSGLSSISYIYPPLKSAAQALLVTDNAQLVPTHPPINIRFQSFLI